MIPTHTVETGQMQNPPFRSQIAEGLLNWFSWRGVLAATGIVSLLLGEAYAKYGKGGDFSGKAPRLETFRVLLKNRGFWIMLFLFGLGIGGTIGIYTVPPADRFDR